MKNLDWAWKRWTDGWRGGETERAAALKIAQGEDILWNYTLALEFGTIFLLQHGGAVPAELSEDGGAVAGGEHKGAVQRLHGRCQVRALQWLGYSTVQYSGWYRRKMDLSII